jgi:cytosine/adenosine deaminase-related metal-dependent hydrolase
VPRWAADWIVPVATPPLRGATVSTSDDGRVLAIEAGQRPGDPRIRGVVLPAFTNAHVHLELSGLRGRAPGGAGFLPWVSQMLNEREALGRDELLRAVPAAVDEALRFGTAAVGEVTNTLDTVPAMAAAGLRGVVFHELLERDELLQPDAIAWATGARAARHPWPPRLSWAVAPHAPYSTSASLIQRAAAATPAGVPTTIHLAEDAAELALLADGSGPWPRVLRAMGVWNRAHWVPRCSPVEHLERLGFLARRPPPLVVHLVHASASDLARLAACQATVVLCPRSNLHIGGRLPDVPALVAAGVPLALGTDSLSSNESLSLFGEMATLARAFPQLEPAAVVRWATLGGAVALGLSDQLGALTPGQQPGVIAVRGEAGDDPHAFLVRAQPQEVTWLARA